MAAGEYGAQTPQRKNHADRFGHLEIGDVFGHRI